MAATPQRQCGECNLCCRLLPMKADAYPPEKIAEIAGLMIAHGLASPAHFKGMIADFDKPAGTPCQHQSHAHGCNIYSRRPFGCRFWNCRWLVNDDTAELRRPDRSRYVVDIMPDFVTMAPNDGSPPTNIAVVQVWVDPKDRDAWWRDDALRAFLDRRGQEGMAALIRWSAHDGMTVFPPSMTSDGSWRTRQGISRGEHRGEELFAGLASARKVKVE